MFVARLSLGSNHMMAAIDIHAKFPESLEAVLSVWNSLICFKLYSVSKHGIYEYCDSLLLDAKN